MDKLQIIKGLEQERSELVEKLKSLDMTILTMKQSANLSYNQNGSTNGSNTGYSKPVVKYEGYQQAKSNKKRFQ